MTEPTHPDVSPPPAAQLDHDLVAQLLDQILERAHPLLAEGLYLAAVPHEFDLALFTALRARDDQRDERLLARLTRFSFVRTTDDPDAACFAVQATERQILLRRWIQIDRQAFVQAHQRALDFWQTHPHHDPFTQDLNLVYHALIADPEQGLYHLGRTFHTYTGERRLAEVDRLLSTAVEVRPYLEALSAPWLAHLDDLLAYHGARLAQLRGQWQVSLARLQDLNRKPDLSPHLRPFVVRAYGAALARTGLHVEAIEQYQTALEAFARQPDMTAEQAFTQINLGDAHVDLAVSARGYRELVVAGGQRWQRWLAGLLSLRGLLPLIVYLSLHFGLRVWRPGFWPALQDQDWIIARLFVTGAQWYRRARRLLSTLDTAAGRIQADEKLANLYLTMGDAAQAATIFGRLLDESQNLLGEYRRASIQAGLGQACLRLARFAQAQAHLEKALPVIQAYHDLELEAETHGLLAEVHIRTGQHTAGLTQFRQALRLYQNGGDRVGATEIAERLQQLTTNQRLSLEERETASTTTQNLTRRQYLRRFQHPALIAFRRAGLVLLAVFAFAIPMLAIHVQMESIIDAAVHFYPSPLTAPNPDFSPTLSQTMALSVQPSFEAEFALQQALALLLLYLLAYTILGVVLILRTPLRTVQAAQAETVRLDLHGLTVGQSDTEQTTTWQEIERISIADIEFFHGPMDDNSRTIVQTPQGQLEIKGSIAWYTALQSHIRAFAAQARVTSFGYRVLASRMGVLYGLSLLGLALFLLLTIWAPHTLLMDLIGPYSLADLYPYLYIGLLLPPFWWLVVRPLYIQAHLAPQTRLFWWVGGAGVALAGLRFVFPRPWLIAPDIYPALSVVLLLASAVLALWQVRRPHGYPLWLRALTTAIAGGIIVLASLQIGREMRVYHLMIQGNSQRDAAIRAANEDRPYLAEWWLQKAADSYSRLLQLAPQNLTALRSRAAVQAQMGHFERAIDDYSAALQHPNADNQDYAYRAMAHESWGLALLAEGDQAAGQEKLQQALADLDRATDLYPQDDVFFVRRGAIYQVLKQTQAAQAQYEQALALEPQNGQAHLAQGWLLFQQAIELSDAAAQKENADRQQELEAQSQDVFGRALTRFQQAAASEPDLPEVWLAVGYGHFRLEAYEATIQAWEKAIALAPDDPVMIISRAMSHWLLADASRCSDDTAAAAEKQEAVEQLNLAIADLDRALALRPTDDWTYRTRAQVEFLLRFCPGYDYQQQVRQAIASYGEALQYAPDNDFYWQFVARLETVLAQHIFLNQPGDEAQAWTMLQIAQADIDRALALNPADQASQQWHAYIHIEAWGVFHWLRGWNHYQAGRYYLAEADSATGALLLPKEAEVAFNAGLAAAAQGKAGAANDWYVEGLRRAQAHAAAEPDAYLPTLQVGLSDLTAHMEANPSLRWLIQPILGLFHRQLGQEYLAAGDYISAWEEFTLAATLQPQDAVAAFKAGLLALVQGKSLQAAEWYQEGLRRASIAPNAETTLQMALDDLDAMQRRHPGVTWLARPLLDLLWSAMQSINPTR
ncbi:MAG: tetratricopeptide repeat protein [Chloroflexota bacterium]